MINIVKPFLDKDLASRIQMYGPNPAEWKPVLAEEFDWDQIPVSLGGSVDLSGIDSD
jgi:hypothetical protein